MSAGICVTGGSETGIDALIQVLRSAEAAACDEAAALNGRLRAAISGSTTGLREALRSPAEFRLELDPLLSEGHELAYSPGAVFGGTGFAETLAFWRLVDPALACIVLVPPPPVAERDLHAVDLWFLHVTAALRESAGMRRLVLVTPEDTPSEVIAGAALRFAAGETAGGFAASAAVGDWRWLDWPALPAPAAFLYAGLQLLAVRAAAAPLPAAEDLTEALVDAAEHRWHVERDTQRDHDAVVAVNKDFREHLDETRRAHEVFRRQLAELESQLGRTEDDLTRTAADLEKERARAEVMEQRLREAEDYIALVKRTPAYRGLAAARVVGDRVQSVIRRR